MKNLLKWMLICLTFSLSAQVSVDCEKRLETVDGMEVRTVAGKMPEYKGGNQEYFRLISKHLKYPRSQTDDFQASVFIAFVIDTLGRVRNECVIKRFSDAEITPLEKEVLGLVLQFQDWKPGEHDGKKVPVKFLLPLRF